MLAARHDDDDDDDIIRDGLPSPLRKLPQSNDFSQLRRVLYRDLLAGSVSDPLEKRLGLSLEEIHSHWSWVPGTCSLSTFLLIWWFAWNELLLSDVVFKASIAETPDCACSGSGFEKTVEHAFYYGGWLRPIWDNINKVSIRIDPKKLVQLDVAYVVNNVDSL